MLYRADPSTREGKQFPQKLPGPFLDGEFWAQDLLGSPHLTLTNFVQGFIAYSALSDTLL